MKHTIKTCRGSCQCIYFDFSEIVILPSQFVETHWEVTILNLPRSPGHSECIWSAPLCSMDSTNLIPGGFTLG
jgi:hypothetical protein